jgi:YacP-like NYN domain-containing protein
MPYLIDASNLGGALGGQRGARDPEAVIRFLLGWARGRGRVVVVFDGSGDARVAERYGALEVAWGGARSADDAIEALVRKQPRSWTVVTDDRELDRRCRELGARVQRADALIARVQRPHTGAPAAVAAARDAGKPSPSAEDVRHWREVFSDDEG